MRDLGPLKTGHNDSQVKKKTDDRVLLLNRDDLILDNFSTFFIIVGKCKEP